MAHNFMAGMTTEEASVVQRAIHNLKSYLMAILSK
jgi:hypothetical protein